MTRRIVQIASWAYANASHQSFVGCHALYADGSIDECTNGDWTCIRLPDIPQDEPAVYRGPGCTDNPEFEDDEPAESDPIAELEAMGGRLHAEHYSLAWMLHTPGREPDVEIEGVAAAAASGMIVTADLRAAAARLLARVRGGGA